MTLEIRELNEHSNITSRCLIIMPIYNRRFFLEQAFKSLQEQIFQEWNLIIVDDGSDDEPLEEVTALALTISQRITYVKQLNGGPGAARATGQQFLDKQDFVAFFDSDDYWLPTYLKTLIERLINIPKMDWIFCPCRRINYETGETIQESTFLDEKTQKPLRFQHLDRRRFADTWLIEDNIQLALTQLLEPIHAGFQNSVLKSHVVKHLEIPKFRIGEDRYFFLAAVFKGIKVGYVDKICVLYNVHKSNLSDTNREVTNLKKAVFAQEELCRSLNGIKKLTKEKEIIDEINKQISSTRFWLVGYRYYWEHGYFSHAILTMFNVCVFYPTNKRFLKTFFLCLLKLPIKYMLAKLKPVYKNG